MYRSRKLDTPCAPEQARAKRMLFEVPGFALTNSVTNVEVPKLPMVDYL